MPARTKFRTALYAVGFAVLAFCLLLALDFWITAGEWQENSYASLSDAEKDGAISRGWIPDFLPASSREIHEVHDLDSSMVWGTFQFDRRDEQKLRKNLKDVGPISPTQIHIPSPGGGGGRTFSKVIFALMRFRKPGTSSMSHQLHLRRLRARVCCLQSTGLTGADSSMGID